MLVQLGPIVSQAAGSIGGTTFQRANGSTIVRTKPLAIVRRTQYTNAERQTVQYLTRRWRSMSAVVQASWQTAADSITWTNRFGDTIRGLGYWLYIRCNLHILLLGGTLIEAAPAIVAIATITGLAAAVNVAGNTFALSWTSGNVPASTTWAVYATDLLSGGISAGRQRFRYITKMGAGTATGASIRNAYTARFGSLPTTAQRVFVRVLPMTPLTGIAGARQDVLTTVT